MRKAMVIVLSACLLLCGCGSNGVRREEGAPKENVGGRFLCDSDMYHFETVVDTKTGVTYLVWRDGTYRAGITVLLNADGTPVISEEVGE